MGKKTKPGEKAAESKNQKKTFDILNHALVPKHRILTKEEVSKLLQKFQISDFQLPVIRIKDAVCKAIGAQANDIIEIERIAPTGRSLYYRRVLS